MEEVKAVNGVGEGLDVSRDSFHAVGSALDEKLAWSIGTLWDLIAHADATEAQHQDYHGPEGPVRSQVLCEAVEGARALEEHRAALVTEEQVAVPKSREAIETSSPDRLTASEAQAAELEKIAEMCGEADDPFSAWETIELWRDNLQASEARVKALEGALRLTKMTLTVPAAEYVPAITDAWAIIDAALPREG